MENRTDISKLNDRQRLFCEAYAVLLNATQAAIEAGYSKKTAYSQGHELLKKPEIRAYIDELLEQRTIGKREVLARLADMAVFDIGDITDDEGNIDFAKAKSNGLSRLVKSIKKRNTPQGVQWEYELYDAQAALIHLGRAHGAFTDRQEHSGQISHEVTQLPDLSQLTFEQLYELKHGHKPNGA